MRAGSEGGLARREEDEIGGLPAWSAEAVVWLACLGVAVVPTGVVLTVWRAWRGAVTPQAGLLTYIILFTLMVVAMKPWTVC